MDDGVPVRVVRGHECANSYTGRIYTYDGLYKVTIEIKWLISYLTISLTILPRMSVSFKCLFLLN